MAFTDSPEVDSGLHAAIGKRGSQGALRVACGDLRRLIYWGGFGYDVGPRDGDANLARRLSSEDAHVFHADILSLGDAVALRKILPNMLSVPIETRPA